LAVLRLTVSLNLVRVCTGRSPGFAADQVRVVINLKTAIALGPMVPNSLLAIADALIK
jgi:hypothetical protein